MSEAFKVVTYLNDPRVRELESEIVRLAHLVESKAKLSGECQKLDDENFRLRTQIENAEKEIARLKRGDWTAEELAELVEATKGDEDWRRLLADKSVEYSVGEHGLERYGFDTVTVFRREGKEAIVMGPHGVWSAMCDIWNMGMPSVSREDAEAWCVEQLKPKWRAAREDGSDLHKRCRAREGECQEWVEYDHLVAMIEHKYRYLVSDCYDREPMPYQFCEVQD